MTPFRFVAGSGPLRAFHPLAKLAALLSFTALAMRASPYAATAIGASVVVLLAVSGASLSATARKTRFLVWMAAFVSVSKFVGVADMAAAAEAARETGVYLARLVVVFLASELFFRTTSPHELGAGLSGACRFILRRNDLDPGFYLTLAVDFLPRTFDAYARAREAAEARGFRPRLGNAFGSTSDLLASFVANAATGAVGTARALEARAYDPARTLPVFRFRLRDLALVIGAVVAFVLL